MIEIYSNEINAIDFQVSVKGQPEQPDNFSVTTDEGIVPVVNNIDIGKYEIIFNQSDIIGNKSIHINYDYELSPYGTWSEKVEYPVKSRLVSFDELNNFIKPHEPFSYEDYSKLEMFARNIIESFCGQTFDYWRGIKDVISSEETIILDTHIEKLHSINIKSQYISQISYLDDQDAYEIHSSGYMIYNPYKIDVINFLHKKSSKRIVHSIDGDWGWYQVPSAVKQAAFEIIQAFDCADITYRRKFIDNIRSADTRIEFADGAYGETTGNPIADQLLEPYRLYHMGVL